MKNVLLRKGYFAILVDIIAFVIGVILIIFKNDAVDFLLYALSATLVVFGIYKCIKYYRNKHSANDFNFAYGAILVLVAVFIILCMKNIEIVFSIIIGLSIIFSGIMKINMAFQIERDTMWRTILFIAILIILAGIYIIIFPNTLILYIGIIIAIYSVLSIFESLMYIRNVNKIVS